MSSGFTAAQLASDSGTEDVHDALLGVLDRLNEVVPDLEKQSHEIRCQLADLLDHEVSSCKPYPREVLVRLLDRLEYLASTLNRSISGYSQGLPEDQRYPEMFEQLRACGWEEQDARKTDGHVCTPPNGSLTDRTRGRRRVFTRRHEQLMVWFTAPNVVAYAYDGSRWLTNVAELAGVITAAPVNIGRMIAQWEAERRAELRKPFGLTIDEIVDRAQSRWWKVVRDDPCTPTGIAGMPFIGVVPKGPRPGRSVTLRSASGSMEVFAWGLPGQPAGGVRYSMGRVRDVEHLNQILGLT